jgi:hypothetical protein
MHALLALALVPFILPAAMQEAFAYDAGHACTGLFHVDLDGCGDPRAMFSQPEMIVAISVTAMVLSVSMIFFRKYYLKRKDFYTIH